MRRILPLLLLTAASSGCGAGAVARPDDPTYNGTVGANGKGDAICHQVDAEGSPLVVDWKPEERGDLEVAMRQGVAVVHYDCQSVKLLPECHVDGSYGFVGITRKEQVVSLANADEAKANLPLNGGVIGAQMQRGAALDVALVMVGKDTASALRVDKSTLKGRCDGATHFIRGATVGAFAMKTRTSGEAAAAASLFGATASTDSSSKKSVDNQEGDLTACRQSDTEALKPPKNCGAPLRVQLLALDKELDEKQAGKDISCPKGMTAVNGKCAVAAAATTHECKNDDIADCTKQCDAGSVASCQNLGLATLLAGLTESTNKYDALTAHAYDQGCKLDDTWSCGQLGDQYERGSGVPKDLAKAQALYTRACNGGDGTGCRYLAKSVGKSSPGRATSLLVRGCYAGDGESCLLGGTAYDKGDGVPPDPARAKSLYRRGCGLHNKTSCTRSR